MSTVMVPANAAEALGMLQTAGAFLADMDAPGTVSYTHLTLPTICSV